MVTAIVDTHTVIWYIFNDDRLSPVARNRLESAATAGDWSASPQSRWLRSST
jgi:PIN domain nuclease of toxin-antitoxin system